MGRRPTGLTPRDGEGRDLPLWTRDLRVDDRSWRGVGCLPTDVGEEPGGDALLHHHHAQLGPAVNGKAGPGECFSAPQGPKPAAAAALTCSPPPEP